MFECVSENDDLISTHTRSENGIGFKRPGVRKVVENNIFQSETWSGLEEPGGTLTPKIPGNTFPDKQLGSRSLN